jgi:hypothetical protein
MDAEGFTSDVSLLRKQLSAVDRKLHQMRLQSRLEDDERLHGLLQKLERKGGSANDQVCLHCVHVDCLCILEHLLLLEFFHHSHRHVANAESLSSECTKEHSWRSGQSGWYQAAYCTAGEASAA